MSQVAPEAGWRKVRRRADQLALIALGANLPSPAGAPAATLAAAVRRLAGTGGALLAVSRFFATPCFPAGAGPDYVNAAVALHWPGGAGALLRRLHAAEAAFGRERRARWGMRSLDLDLIALGGQVLPDAPSQRRWMDLPADQQRTEAPETLILPHPRLAERAFVLVPLADIAPGWQHPQTGYSVAQMMAALPASERDGIRPLGAGPIQRL